jgi:hypothetical protein
MWLVPGEIRATMLRIAAIPNLFMTNILLDMFTAMGIIFLGFMLFETVRNQNRKMALVALGFYILEAALLAASRGQAFSLLQMSREYAAVGRSAYLETMATLALESMDFVGFVLHMLVFCLGGTLFYYLLFKSKVVPVVLSLWGLITILPLLPATLLGMFGIDLPFILAVPYVPFEFVIGLWILIKGTNQ